MSKRTLEELVSGLPDRPAIEPVPSKAKVVVLDDDPTGTQTVHGIPVLTRWLQKDLEAELRGPGPGFYILTNSRALKPAEAVQLAHEIGEALREASGATGVSFATVSRSDSTLRGHYPAETDALATALGGDFAATILIPAFFAAGRITVDDVHYARVGSDFVPAGETEFARDSSFGFRASNLKDYVAEKTGGRIHRDSVVSLSIQDLRLGGSQQIAGKLSLVPSGGVAIVNAADRQDLFALTHALAREELRDRRFLFRTAADFVAAYMAIPQKALLGRTEMIDASGTAGGLLVAGSYVGQTSRQLEALAGSHPELERIELNVERLLDPSTRATEIKQCRARIDTTLAAGRSAVLFTSRTLVRALDPDADLEIGAQVSSGLVEVVRNMNVRPGWLIAKGGITSSNVATQALGIVRAMVLGQALPGVPVWSCGPECRWPGLSYIVFPGNVGGADALSQIVGTLVDTPRVPGSNRDQSQPHR